MPYDGFSPGSSLIRDEDGCLIDSRSTLLEGYASVGHAWFIGIPYSTLSNAGDYATLKFHTPATGRSLYAFSKIDKTGDELVVTLVEGGTYTGGTDVTPYNLDRTNTEACPFTAIKRGLSASGATIVGGLEAPEVLLGGSSTGLGGSKAGGVLEGGTFLTLKNDTDYVLKITTKGAATFCARATIVCPAS